jgi:hypothetical protein
MRRSLLLTTPVFLCFALAPRAHADLLVYKLSSDGGSSHVGLSGTITIEGDIGETVPELNSASILGFSFTDDGILTFTDTSTAQFLHDNLSFNNTLGAATLTGTGSGEWSIYEPGVSNTSLDLYGNSQTGAFDSKWDDCIPSNSEACFDIGNDPGFWQLTLQSDTPTAPEPSTLWTSFGALGIFGACWMLKRRNAVTNC